MWQLQNDQAVLALTCMAMGVSKGAVAMVDPHEEPNWVGHRDGHLGGLVSPLGQCPNPSVVWGAGGHPLGPPWVHALAPGP